MSSAELFKRRWKRQQEKWWAAWLQTGIFLRGHSYLPMAFPTDSKLSSGGNRPEKNSYEWREGFSLYFSPQSHWQLLILVEFGERILIRQDTLVRVDFFMLPLSSVLMFPTVWAIVSNCVCFCANGTSSIRIWRFCSLH